MILLVAGICCAQDFPKGLTLAFYAEEAGLVSGVWKRSIGVLQVALASRLAAMQIF
jgi:hypothetical protein